VRILRRLLLAFAAAGFAVLLFKHISYPLFWQDEGEVAMFATRVLEYGYPKIHGDRNVLYEFAGDLEIGRDERTDAYIGTTWGHFYFAVPGLLWSRGTGDPHAKTARMRIPFALAGFAGVAGFLLAALPALRSRGERELFAALYLALLCLSISLILHIRETRYYALQVLAGAGVIAVHLRYHVYGGTGFRRYAVWQALLLVLMFNVFFSAWFSMSLLLGLHAAYAGWRRGGAARERLLDAGRGLAPFALSAVLLIPWFVFFETLRIAGHFSDWGGLGMRVYLWNLRDIVGHLARHELLLPALFARAACAALRPEARAAWPLRDPRRRAAAFLLGFSAGYVAVGCLNPLVFERYFLLLSPALAAAFLLDAFTLAEEVPRRFSAGRHGLARAATVVALALVVAGTGGVRAHDLRERIHEITHPMEGATDRVVAYLRRRYPQPESLVIATNYGAHPLMFYLGSHVIVGMGLNHPADLALEPDVVVPRRDWLETRELVADFVERAAPGEFEAVRLGIMDTPFNNIPALSRTNALPDIHRFRTPLEYKPKREMVIYCRLRGGAPDRSGGPR
jgi:hypothetical protein